MSTPRTDAEIGRVHLSEGRNMVTADFARQLERELAAVSEQAHNLQALIATMRTNYSGDMQSAPAALVDVLNDIEEYLERHQDVRDGSDGPRPNEAMSLLTALAGARTQWARDEWNRSHAAPSSTARDAALDEVIAALGERLDSLRIMTDRAGYTREGNDLAQRTSATYDAREIVRAMKSTNNATVAQSAERPVLTGGPEGRDLPGASPSSIERDDVRLAALYRARRKAFFEVRHKADKLSGRIPPSEEAFNRAYDEQIEKMWVEPAALPEETLNKERP